MLPLHPAPDNVNESRPEPRSSQESTIRLPEENNIIRGRFLPPRGIRAVRRGSVARREVTGNEASRASRDGTERIKAVAIVLVFEYVAEPAQGRLIPGVSSSVILVESSRWLRRKPEAKSIRGRIYMHQELLDGFTQRELDVDFYSVGETRPER